MTERLKTIATFSQPWEAHLFKSKLEQEGISCFIEDEYTVSVNWFFSVAIGGLKIAVRESDIDRIPVMRQHELFPFELGESSLSTFWKIVFLTLIFVNFLFSLFV